MSHAVILPARSVFSTEQQVNSGKTCDAVSRLYLLACLIVWRLQLVYHHRQQLAQHLPYQIRMSEKGSDATMNNVVKTHEAETLVLTFEGF